jgi:hypothetical protein
VFDVEKVARGALRTYNLAPSPSTFYTLARGSIGATDELLRDFQDLSASTKQRHAGWQTDAVTYRARLQQEQLQASVVIELVNQGDPDWNKALQAGNDYAVALKKFFMGGDSSNWAALANKLAEIQASEQGSSFNKVTWLTALWGGPFAGGWMAATETLLEGAGEALTEQVEKTKQAAGVALTEAGDFMGKAGIGLLGLAIGIGAAWFFLKD